jgi:neutral ceramidase
MSARCLVLALSLLWMFVNSAEAADAGITRAGAAKVDITPDYPIRLAGYASRNTESQGIAQRIWAKALALGNDEGEGPALLVTVESCGVPESLIDEVFAKLRATGLRRHRLLVCVTHSHSAPWAKGFAEFAAQAKLPPEHQERRVRYTRELSDKLAQVATAALQNRQPAKLFWTQGQVTFAANRRVLKEGSWTGFGVQRGAPVDFRMPLLVAKAPDGKVLALWTNYACHCTTLGGDFNQICGDWAGYAQEYLEADCPGAVALVSLGCGADMNPDPRGKLEHCQQHGRAVAEEVKRLLRADLKPVDPTLVCRLVHVDLPFVETPPRPQWEQAAQRTDPLGQRARYFVELLDRGEKIPAAVSYPIATWTFGKDLQMVFLAGEVVVDYALRLAPQGDTQRLWITAYANDATCYIPSKRILQEGGYEADSSMIYYGRPARFRPEVEDLVVDTVLKLLAP